MNCPVCVDVSLAMADRQGVEIDYCPKCRGIWLDRGELDKLIARAGEGGAPARPELRSEYRPDPRASAPPRRRDDDDDDSGARRIPPGYGRSDDSDAHRGQKKRGGWLGELLDF